MALLCFRKERTINNMNNTLNILQCYIKNSLYLNVSLQLYVTQVAYMDIVLQDLTTVSVTVHTQGAHVEKVIISK